jgi:spermidine synthase
MLTSRRKQVRPQPDQTIGEVVIGSVDYFTILLSGFLSIVVQVMLMREIVTVFQGNEFLMIWTLSVWMLLTGAGTWIGNRLKVIPSAVLIQRIMILCSISPVILILLINVLKNIIFPPGVLVNPYSFFLIVLIILSPICIPVGMTYSLLVKNIHSRNQSFVRVYALETIGCMAGGLVTSFLLIQWISVTQSLLILCLMVFLAFYTTARKQGYFLGSILITILLVCTYVFPINCIIKSGLFINQKVVDTRETYYGNITITEKSDQYNFYENGSLLFTSQNIITSEEYVHYALLQHKMPENILLVSGGVSGMLDELLKYQSLQSVSYVEINPDLVHLAVKYFHVPSDNRITIIFEDIRKYLRSCTAKYDVAIVALPDPTSLQINRLYTDEFVHLLSGRMAPGGIVIYGLNSVGNYISDVQRTISALMFNTLKRSFRNVLIIPGEKDYYLASDSALNPAIAELWTNNPIENLYVNSYYIDDQSIRERGDNIRNAIRDISLINTDNRPLPVFYNTLYYFSHFHFRKELLWGLVVILLLLPLLFMRPLNSGIYLVGFSGVAAELLVIFIFQIVYGFVYSAIGFIIAFFMCGLALGSILANRLKTRLKHFWLVQAIMIVYFILLPLLLFVHTEKLPVLGWFILMMMIVLPSSVVGFMYVVATQLSPRNMNDAASGMYATDLLGAAAGVLVVSIFSLPFLGIAGTCMMISALNILGILLGFIRNAKIRPV